MKGVISMFHTILINYELTAIEFNRIFNDMKAYTENKGAKFYRIRKTNTYLSEATKDSGVIWYLNGGNNKLSFQHYAITVKINPKILIGNKSYLDVARFEDIENMICKFTELSRQISCALPAFLDYNLIRVDYCVNINVSDLRLTPERLIELIRRSDKPTGFVEWESYDKKSHRKKPGKYSYYLINNSLHINFYYKLMQLEAEFPTCLDIDGAESIIRFEVQCLRPKIYSMKRSVMDSKNILLELLLAKTCEKVILNYFERTIGFEPYMTLSNAKVLVQDSELKEKRKKELIKALELINAKRSIWKARESLSTKKEIQHFNKSLKRIKELGINPVTIPISFGIEVAPNLISKVKDQF